MEMKEKINEIRKIPFKERGTEEHQFLIDNDFQKSIHLYIRSMTEFMEEVE